MKVKMKAKMKVKINGKIFKAHEKKDSQFEIGKDLDMFDLMFFKEWALEDLPGHREDIPFVSKVARGKYMRCFPCEVGENKVIIVYNAIQAT